MSEHPILSNKLCKKCGNQTVYLYQKRKNPVNWVIVGVRCPKCGWVECEKGYE